MKKILAILLLININVSMAGGVATPLVTQENLKETVCNYDIDGLGTNWVSAQRPPSSYTQAWEVLNGGNKTTVVDHILPLCAGGDARNYGNYQLQLTAASYKKDVTERLVCKLLCDGTLTLKQAQAMFW